MSADEFRSIHLLVSSGRKIFRQLDIYFFYLILFQIIYIDIPSVFEGDRLITQRWEFAIIGVKMSDLSCFTRLCIIFDQVHDPVPVTHEVNLVFMIHREDILSRMLSYVICVACFGLNHSYIFLHSDLIIVPGTKHSKNPVHCEFAAVFMEAATAGGSKREFLAAVSVQRG